MKKVTHQIDPIWNNKSKILILGTMPSQKSREQNFYYAHKQNRFWPVIEGLFNITLTDNKEKEAFLKENKIAVWDVIKSCDIDASSDSSIRNVEPNDLVPLIKGSEIKAIFTTGTTAFKFYNRYCKKETGIEAICLPSTSPANAKWKINDLISAYSVIFNYL